MAFPVITPSTIDNLRRGNEDPVSDGGRWSPIFGHAQMGRIHNLGWNAQGEFGGEEDNAAYWNVEKYGPVTGIKTKVEVIPKLADEFLYLFACLSDPASAACNGYRVSLHGAGVGFHKFIWQLEKQVNGEWEVLETSSAMELNELDEIAFSVQEGKLQGWHREEKTEPWTLVIEAADASYTKGYIGIGGVGPNILLSFLEVGPPPAEEEHHEEPHPPKVSERLAAGDIVPGGGNGTVLMVRDMGRAVMVKFTNGVTKLYRRAQRIYL